MFSFLLGTYLGVTLLRHMAGVCLVFKPNCKMMQPAVHGSPRFSTCWSTLVLSQLLAAAIPGGAQQRLLVLLLCVSLMTNHVEHLFMCLVIISICVCVKCLLPTQVLYIVWIQFISYMLHKYFSQSLTCLLIFLMVSFEQQNFLKL